MHDWEASKDYWLTRYIKKIQKVRLITCLICVFANLWIDDCMHIDFFFVFFSLLNIWLTNYLNVKMLYALFNLRLIDLL